MSYTIEQVKKIVEKRNAFSDANPKADENAEKKNSNFFEILAKLPVKAVF